MNEHTPTNNGALQERKIPNRWILRGVLVMFLLLAGLMGHLLYLMGPTGAAAEVRIPRGSGAQAVGRLLEQAGLVRSGYLFALYLRFSGLDKALKPGFYRLEGRGIRAIALALTDPSRPLRVRITFPEGWRASEMAQRLSEHNLDGARFLELVNQPTPELRPPEAEGPTLEGYLFPATYEFPMDATPEEIIRTMTRRMAQEFTPEALERLHSLGLRSVHAWVTLASIVQAEAANPSEKPFIAGVFLNRLELGMPLQADPTVAYGLGKRLPELDRNAGDFSKDTPYNTYTRRGLPPGPIGNPGAEALRAVLNPIRTNEKGQRYLYFLHAQGRLFLNVDFEGHLRDTARYYR
ncbi:MAG: endolytic transglycosylase MltG [Meiothermus sp.]|uniref:endolytic transglycosylase MltG n=1 Tax=Meiothermus sp. TaxID=1955249 RepID=UPI0025F10DD3|nr:endolytic transglycosylase MltG [Meiothermus sp.]MCS7057579.1 endolytic transglycosylase MltG [Meiothermus sp.]MCS7195224.1 endolytic transglycosylase MltG [Meiothermus sp.]MCX7741382.1 endolytic transglycosylase MltG [Meiothermus sp.]MDW8091118.1 endolytic transglycosylase MltG [Meiothermus sp.]MDW8482359.1 endolytic transglycosylase MltG [Meiothermus sp.]